MTISAHPWDERPKPKLAQQIADEIEREILAQGIIAGQNLGTEAELIARHGVSRAILREALLLVQRGGLAEVRRGKIGGLVVNVPGPARIAALLQNYISFIAYDFQDVLALRRELEDLLLRCVHSRITDEDVAQMEILSQEFSKTQTPRQRTGIFFRMLDIIGRASGNPLLHMLVAALAGATHEHLIRRNVSDRMITNSMRKIYDLRHSQMRALMAADMGQTAALNEQIHREYNLVITLLHDMRHSPTPGYDQSALLMASYRGRAEGDVLSLEHKLAEKVARRMRDQIILSHVQPGDTLGSEMSLMKQFKVSRGVMREAVRILERQEIVYMVRGKHGGLKITRPDPRNLVRTASIYLHALQLQARDVRAVGTAIGLVAVEQAAARIQNVQHEDFAAARATLRSAPPADYTALDRAQLDIVSAASGSHIIGLLLSLVGNLYGPDQLTPLQIGVTARK